MEHAETMNDLMRRYKSAVKASMTLQKKEDVASHMSRMDALVAGLQDTRAALARAVAADTAALQALRSREAALAGEVQALGAQRAEHQGQRASAGAALAASASAQAGCLRLAAASVTAAAGATVRSLAREAAGELRSSRNYTMSVSHRADLSCTGFLASGARPAVVTHARTLPPRAAGGSGPSFSPMRPRGGSAPKAGGLTILSSKGGGAVAITSAISQGARITIEDEAALLGYGRPADREYAAVTAPTREVSIRRAATGI